LFPELAICKTFLTLDIGLPRPTTAALELAMSIGLENLQAINDDDSVKDGRTGKLMTENGRSIATFVDRAAGFEIGTLRMAGEPPTSVTSDETEITLQPEELENDCVPTIEWFKLATACDSNRALLAEYGPEGGLPAIGCCGSLTIFAC
jgi:hypothetical protein